MREQMYAACTHTHSIIIDFPSVQVIASHWCTRQKKRSTTCCGSGERKRRKHISAVFAPLLTHLISFSSLRSFCSCCCFDSAQPNGSWLVQVVMRCFPLRGCCLEATVQSRHWVGTRPADAELCCLPACLPAQWRNEVFVSSWGRHPVWLGGNSGVGGASWRELKCVIDGKGKRTLELKYTAAQNCFQLLIPWPVLSVTSPSSIYFKFRFPEILCAFEF